MRKSLYLSCILALAAAGAASAQTLSDVKEGARTDLSQALDELAALRKEIRQEKVPLAKKRRTLQSEVDQLRREAREAGSARDSADLRLEQLQNRIEGREEEIQYASNLLDEFIRGMQSRIHVSEVARYEPRLVEILNEAEEAGEDPSSVGTMARGVAVGLERAKDILGGTVFGGEAVTPDGEFVEGEFALIGPLAYFGADASGGIVLRGESMRPSVAPVPETDVAGAVAALASGESAEVPVDATLGNARAIEQTKETLVEHVRKGGIWIIPILGFALASISIALFKALELYSIRMPDEGVVQKITRLLGEGKKEEATKEASNLPGPAGEMLRTGIRHSEEPVTLLEELCMEKVLETQPKTQRLLAFIGTTAAVSPLLGLLGTVTGMINTFKLITIFGTGDARNLSSGISEALVTTEFGLIVAIPALILHALLSRRANGLLATMEKQAIAFVNAIKIQRETA